MSKKNITIKVVIIFVAILFIYVGLIIYTRSTLFLIKPTARQNHTEMLPTESFEINFSNAIDKEYYKKKISLEPRTPMKAIINEGRDKIILTPTEAWNANTNYRISIPDGRATNFRPIQKASFSFRTAKNPEVVSVTPENDTKDVIISMEDPIKIDFNKSTEGFFVEFILEPPAEVVYRNNDEKTSFEILPKDGLGLEEGIEYKLIVKSKPQNSSDEQYEELSSTSFSTLPPKPVTWSDKLEERIKQSEKFTQPQIKDGKYIDINLATQIMTTFEDGEKLGTFLISSGKAGMNTPKGAHQIYNKFPRPWSSKYGLYMPYWMAITSDGGYGIHELPEWPGGYKEGQDHLGTPVSHGCVRLGIGNSQRVYNWAEVGTPVIVY
ncbi:MAG: L,D-transpeptidase family protein [Candidatus Moranbacteria bacterium]|nr:L,D-transpeptidase family protein [Candidatus Moranbacteria bacterium]